MIKRASIERETIARIMRAFGESHVDSHVRLLIICSLAKIVRDASSYKLGRYHKGQR